jgi:hypothetical protein
MVCSNRCAGCAFTPGTPANQSPRTVLVAQLCVMARDPFFCHENVDGEIIDGVAQYWPKEGTQLRACAGWIEAVAALGPEPEWRAGLAAEFLEMLLKAEDGGGDWSDERALAEIQGAIGRVDATVGREVR